MAKYKIHWWKEAIAIELLNENKEIIKKIHEESLQYDDFW